MINKELLQILVCPDSRQSLAAVEEHEVAGINEMIKLGLVLSAKGEKVETPIDALLVREDGKLGYVVRNGIPVLLVDEAIDLSSVVATA